MTASVEDSDNDDGADDGVVVDDPLVVTARAAGDAIHTLISRIAPRDVDLAADLVEAVAVLECCAFEASLDRGRVRRRLCEIALVKAMLCRAALDDVIAQRLVPTTAVTPARRALDAACAALAPLPRLALSELLRR